MINSLFRKETKQGSYGAEHAYITSSNFKRLCRDYLRVDGDVSLDKVFDAIYRVSLSEILSHDEASALYIQKEILSGRFGVLRREANGSYHHYIFKVTPPKFHLDGFCKYLHAKFINYEVPAEISALGEGKVREFREFCEAEKRYFEGKSDDVFWAHVGARFKVRISPKKVVRENSLPVEIEKMSIAELQALINENIAQAVAIVEGDASGTMDRLRYASNVQYAQRVLQREGVAEGKVYFMVKKFFYLKFLIVNSLFEIYRKQSVFGGCVMPVHLLHACGLEPCKACSGQANRHADFREQPRKRTLEDLFASF